MQILAMFILGSSLFVKTNRIVKANISDVLVLSENKGRMQRIGKVERGMNDGPARDSWWFPPPSLHTHAHTGLSRPWPQSPSHWPRSPPNWHLGADAPVSKGKPSKTEMVRWDDLPLKLWLSISSKRVSTSLLTSALGGLCVKAGRCGRKSRPHGREPGPLGGKRALASR